MTYSIRSKQVTAILTCIAILMAVPVPAQDVFRTVEASTKLRDAVVDATTGILYATAYAREELWKVNSQTGEAIAKVKAGKGPASVALSLDGKRVACVNKLSADVSIFEADSMVLMGTFPCQDGASEITALPDGAFAVVNSFADSVSVVDPVTGKTTLISDIGRVPNGVASEGRILAVTTRLPASVLLIDTANGYGAPTPARVALPATPLAVAGDRNGGFFIATETGLLRLNARNGEILARADTVAQDVAGCGDHLLAISGSELVKVDQNLKIVDRVPLGLVATRLDCAGGIVALVAPAEDALLIRGDRLLPSSKEVPEPATIEPLEPLKPEPESASPILPEQREEDRTSEGKRETTSPVPAAPKAETPKAPDSNAPAVVEAEPVQESKKTELAPFPAMPKPGMEEGPAPAAQPEPKPTPPVEKKQAETRSEPLPPAPDKEQSAQSESQSDTTPGESTENVEMAEPESNPYAQRPTMMTTFGTGAPQFSREAPNAAPTGDIWSGGLSEAFTKGLDFGSLESAFQGQNWEEPLEFKNVKAGAARITPTQGGKLHWVFREDVAWTWGETTLNAQLFDANLDTREVIIEDAHLQRELSSLDADKLYYRYPSEYDEATLPLIEAEDLTAQERARRLYTFGYGEADNIEIIEPMRELRAQHIEYDFAKGTGMATDVRGRLDVLYFGVDEMEMLGPEQAYARGAWVTTCPGDPPFFRLRLKEMDIQENDVVVGKKARLQIGKVMTPIYWPRWTFRPGMDKLIDIDFDSGRAAELGYYLNYGQRFAVSPQAELGFRFFPTEKEGVGFGLEGDYDYMNKPSSPLFRGKGDFRSLITTEERGYLEAYHRHELTEDAVALFQTEYWDDPDIIKDFYYNEYRNRTEPRTFANLTYTRPTYLATATARYNASDFVVETERLPEATYHMLDRQLAGRLYVSLDTIAGHNEREPSDTDALRLVNVARASLDLELAEALSIIPFYEADLSWYSDTVDEEGADARFANTVGVTAQSRFHRAYPGALGFSGFKHVIVPSVTYSYRPEPTMGVDETLRFDAYDNVYGRSRIESKVGNMLFARDALTGEVWQAARLTLYHGNDFWNEIRSSSDYEIELDLRPRPWWGILTAGEHHSIDNDADLDEPYLFQRLALEFWEDMFGRPYDPELAFRYNAVYGDYDRILSYLYYDDLAQGGNFGARLGFAYTETQGDVFNREILYGARYKLSEKWAFAFEHRYDLEGGQLYQQEYEVRKRFQCFDWSVQIRDRSQGWDFNVAISLSAFPGTKVKF